MRVLKTYRYSEIVAVLLLLCMLLCSAESFDPTMRMGDDFFEIQYFEDLQNNSTNATGSTTEDPAATVSGSTIATEESNETISAPVEQIEEPAGLPVAGSTIILDVETTMNLELVDTSSLMDEGQLAAFQEITVGFLSFYLFRGDFITSLVEEEGVELELIGQKRAPYDQSVQQRNDIEEPLYVDFRVTGKINSVNKVDTNPIVEKGNLELDQVLKELFTEKETEYLESLKFIDGDYFASVNKVNIVAAEEMIQDNNVPKNEENDQKPPDAAVPTPENTYRDPILSSSGDVLSLGAIIGIAVSGTVLLAAVVVLVYVRRRSGSGKRIELKDSDDSVANEILLSSNQVSSDMRSDLGSNDDLESQGMYSYNQESIYTNGSNIKLSSSRSYNYGADSMSYAYSLEQGIEASVISDFSGDQKGSGMPIREIPQVRMDTSKAEVDRNKAKSKTNTKEEYVMKDHFGNTQIETAPSDLKLTKSELEMLPSNLRSSTDESDFEDKSTLTISAPAGKLGIVIDTSIEGPIVHSVKKGGQMFGKIFPGDIIVAIDEVDTRAMSSSAINAVMAKTAKQNRNLTVRRKS